MATSFPFLGPTSRGRAFMRCTRVMLVNNLTQPGFHNVRINLCRAHVGMTEHLLDATQVCSALKEVCGKCVPHDVRAQSTKNSSGFSVFPKQLPEALSSHARPPCRYEEERA